MSKYRLLKFKLDQFLNVDSTILASQINELLQTNVNRKLRIAEKTYILPITKFLNPETDQKLPKAKSQTQANALITFNNFDIYMHDFVLEFIANKEFSVIFNPSLLKTKTAEILTNKNVSFVQDFFDFPYHFDFKVTIMNKEYFIDVYDEYKCFVNTKDHLYYEEEVKRSYCVNEKINYLLIDETVLMELISWNSMMLDVLFNKIIENDVKKN